MSAVAPTCTGSTSCPREFVCRMCGESVRVDDPADRRTVFCSAGCQRRYWRHPERHGRGGVRPRAGEGAKAPTNWERYFGTPARAAMTIEGAVRLLDGRAGADGAAMPGRNGAGWLEWLESEVG